MMMKVVVATVSVAWGFQMPIQQRRSVVVGSTIELKPQGDAAELLRLKEQRKEFLPPSPLEQTAELLVPIEDMPKLAISGNLFNAPDRSDQFLLDCVHGQKVWNGIVAFSTDTALFKRQMMSRTARYSGLLDALTMEEVPADASPAGLAKAVKATGAKAWLIFGIQKLEARQYLEAAKDAGLERVVVATDARRSPPTLAGPGGDTQASWQSQEITGPAPSDFGDMMWTIVDFEIESFNDDLPEGGPLCVNRENKTASELEPDKTLARADAYRLVAEAFQLKPAQRAKLVIENGGTNASAVLRDLREAGFTRQGEVAKMVNGSMDTHAAEIEVKRQLKEKRDYFAKWGRDPDYLETLKKEDEERKEREKRYEINTWRRQREEEIMNLARTNLANDWRAKKFHSARAFTKEEWIQQNWSQGCQEAAESLGFIDKLTTNQINEPNYTTPMDVDPAREEPEDMFDDTLDYITYNMSLNVEKPPEPNLMMET